MTAEQARIRQLEDEITKRDNTILLQQNSIKDLQRQVDNLTEIILQMRHDKFGPSSEKTVREDESDRNRSGGMRMAWRPEASESEGPRSSESFP